MGFSLEQGFATKPVANIRVCLYTLSIRAPDSQSTLIDSYTFPISPQFVRKSPIHMTALHDVQNTSANGGVFRMVDQFGQAPPIYTIRGTTGWRLHNSDGYIWNGISSIQKVQSLLTKFEGLNQQQMMNNNPHLYTMEFYDYYMEDFYQVVPFGEQGIEQNSAQSTLLSYFTFRFAAIQDISASVNIVEDVLIAKLFGVGALSALNQVTGLANSIVGGY